MGEWSRTANYGAVSSNSSDPVRGTDLLDRGQNCCRSRQRYGCHYARRSHVGNGGKYISETTGLHKSKSDSLHLSPACYPKDRS